MPSKTICVICLNILLLPWTRAELFSATAKLDPLIETHERILHNLDDYVTKEDARLTTLKSYLKVYKEEQDNAIEDIPNYLGNPINAYTLIKRLTIDVTDIEKLIELGKENIKSVALRHSNMTYPTLDDMKGAVQAITRLQITYELVAHDLTEGRIKGIQYSNPMTASDCFEFSRETYLGKDYHNTVAWGLEALSKYREGAPPLLPFKETDILEYISSSHYWMGNITTALVFTRQLLRLDPKHPRGRLDMQMFVEATGNNQSEDTEDIEGMDVTPAEKIEFAEIDRKYLALCRGEIEISSEVAKRLRCRYMTESHPFLRLAPFKVEQLYVDPDVLLFHDVLSDGEMETIKKYSMPRLHRALVLDPKSGEFVPTKNRISQVAWLHDASPVVGRLSRRVAAVTGLSVLSAPELQVLNYGIGGLYIPHVDFSRDIKTLFGKLRAVRIATVIFYMSNVEEGGATVFPELGLSVSPVKGTALFWHNVLPSGEGDNNTLHGACPVLRGSRWVATKWLLQEGQDRSPVIWSMSKSEA